MKIKAILTTCAAVAALTTPALAEYPDRALELTIPAGAGGGTDTSARKLAILFYNTLRYGVDYSDPGASYYEVRHRVRVLHNLARRAKQLGYTIEPVEPATVEGVS